MREVTFPILSSHHSRMRGWFAQAPQQPSDAGVAAASAAISPPGSQQEVGKASELRGQKLKKRRKAEAGSDAGTSAGNQPDGGGSAKGFMAPPPLAAGNPFALLMRPSKKAGK